MNTRTILITALISALVPVSPVFAQAASWSEIETEIIEESRQTMEAADHTLKLIKMSRQDLEAELTRLKARRDELESAYNSKKNRFQSMLDREQELTARIESEKEEIKNVEDAVYNAAQKTHSLVDENPITAEYPGRISQLEPLITKEKFPGMEGIRTLVDIIWTEMTASGVVKKYVGTFVGPHFKETLGEIVRVGPLPAAYKLDNGGVGYLRVGENKRLVAVGGDIGWFTERTLSRYIDGKSEHMPIDVSGGTVFRVLAEEKTWSDYIEAGGLLIWPILLVGAAALILALERFIFLLRIRANSDKIMQDLESYIQQEQYDEARQYCEQKKRFPTCSVVGDVLQHLGVSREVMENAVQEAILRQVPRLERFVATLAILAAIAPLLGLLGTVTGMINTFQVITLFGTGDPKLMSGGISEALVTTQLGLAVAIPIMLLHHFLERRVDKILADIEEKGNKIILTLLKKGAISEGASDSAV